jgi:hypothetical protein
MEKENKKDHKKQCYGLEGAWSCGSGSANHGSGSGFSSGSLLLCKDLKNVLLIFINDFLKV